MAWKQDGYYGGTTFDYSTESLQAGATGRKHQQTWYALVDKNKDGRPNRKRYGRRRFVNNGVWKEDITARDNITETDTERTIYLGNFKVVF